MEKRVRIKRRSFREFITKNLGWFVGVALATALALHDKEIAKRWHGGDRICLTENNLMPVKQVPPQVKPAILAKDHPTILTVFPHLDTLLVRISITRG